MFKIGDFSRLSFVTVKTLRYYDEIDLPEPIKIRDLPAEDTVASLVHKGPYETINEAYGALMTWYQANGYELSGPDREVYLIGPNDTGDPEEYVTELQQPVSKIM